MTDNPHEDDREGGVAGGMIGAATIAPAAAAPAEMAAPPPMPVVPVLIATPPSLVQLLPAPLACLVTTGFGMFCLGIT